MFGQSAMRSESQRPPTTHPGGPQLASAAPSVPARNLSSVRRAASIRLWLANIGIAVVLGATYLRHAPDGLGPKALLFLPLALISTAFTLCLLPGAGLWFASGRLESTKTLGCMQAVLWTTLQVLLVVDTRIYNLFRYHFTNGHIWNLLYTPGSGDSVSFGWQVWVVVTLLLAGGITLQLLLWKRALRLAKRDHERRERARLKPATSRRFLLRLQPTVLWAAMLLSVILLEKTIYAQADLERDHQVTSLSRLFPCYPSLPVDDLASAVLGMELPARPRIELEGVRLTEIKAPDIDPAGPRPNILICVIDCWRSDMLNDDITPQLSAFADRSRRFDRHVSGGNSTRFGLFSMLYGLHGSYWFPVLAENRSPLLVDSLIDLDYDLRIFSSASMTYPELRSTAWTRIQEQVYDSFDDEEEAWRRDEQLVDSCSEWWEERDQSEPFFGFLLFDSPHQTYSHPPDRAPFQPSAETIDYVALSRTEPPEPAIWRELFNRYRNALHHADRQVGELLRRLEESGELENTIVIVTGDHGEEFREHGFFGHTSNFTPVQVQVPLLMRGPGIEAGIETHVTSHLDLAPTLLEMLGADPAQRGDWCLGQNLLSPSPTRRPVMAGWGEIGMWVQGGIVRVPLTRLSFNVEIYDYDWNYLAQDEQIMAAEAEALHNLGEECNRFLRD